MRDGWHEAGLGEVSEIKTGYPFKSSDYCGEAEGIRLLRGDNVVQRGLRWDGARYWPRDQIAPLTDYLLRDGDVVLAMDRPWIEAGLKVARIREADTPSLLVQRVARLRAKEPVDQKFLPWALYTRDFTEYIKNVHTGTAVPHISPTQIGEYRFSLPPLQQQQQIAEILGALEDLIDTNQRLATRLLDLGKSQFVAQAVHGQRDSIGARAGSIARGITPRYSEAANAVTVLNQKCVRADRVGTASSRLMEPRKVAHGKSVAPGDSLVNSTGVGTLGRVGRWLGSETIFADSHLTIIKPDASIYPAALLAYGLIVNAPQIEALAEGSTGQVELSRQRLADLEIEWPEGDNGRLATALDQIDQTIAGLEDEIDQIRRTRNELLPLLMSGAVSPGEVAVAS